MKILCVLAYYNRPRLVRYAIESVRAQSHSDWILVVVDDNSYPGDSPSDDGLLFPGDLLDVDERIRLVKAPERPELPRGPARLSAAINHGLMHTAFVIGGVRDAENVGVCYLADDDWLHPGWFAEISAALDAEPEVEVVYGRLLYSTLLDGWNGDPHSPGAFVQASRFPRDFETPAQQLDHNQVAHRLSAIRDWKMPVWTEDDDEISAKVRARTGSGSRGPDAAFFAELWERSALGSWKALDVPAAFKRKHSYAIIGTRPGGVGERREE